MDTDRIEKQVLLHAPVALVWSAISDSTEFGLWFGAKFEGPFEAGKPVTGAIKPTTVDEEVAKMQRDHEGASFEIVVERIEPERLLSFRWSPASSEPQQPSTLVEFKLEPTADGTLLTISESGFDQLPSEVRAQMFSSNEKGWEIQTTLIAKYLAKTG